MKNTVSKLVLTFTLLLALTIYTKADTIKLVVKEDRASCTGVAPMTCYQVKYKNSKDWELFYDQIAGFHYKPGYRYVIQVVRTKRKNVPADASAYTYKLKKILKKQKITIKTVSSTVGDAWGFVIKHKWNLIQMDGVTQENSPAFLIFEPGKNRFNGYAGCNNFFGGYEKTEDTISFKQIGSTLMACSDEEKNKLESALLKLLSEKTFRYDIADQVLNLYYDNRLVLMFGMADLQN